MSQAKEDIAVRENDKKYITVLGLLACFCVVLMHVNNYALTDVSNSAYFAGNIVNVLSSFAVPVFLMISGANLLDYRDRYSTKSFFIKRINKVFIPFLCFSTIAYFYCVFFQDMPLKNVFDFIIGIFQCQYVGAYWFFITLFMCYLCMPILSDINHKQSVFKYAIIVYLILDVILPVVNYSFSIEGSSFITFAALGGNLIYLIIGYYIDHYDLHKITKIVIYVSGIISAILAIVYTYKISLIWNFNISYYYDSKLFSILYSSAIFLLFKEINFNQLPEKIYKVIKWLATTTFGVYLLHMFLVELIKVKFGQLLLGLPFRLLMTLAIFIVSIFIVKLLQKIPVLRRLVP